jgi:hypothetical protein
MNCMIFGGVGVFLGGGMCIGVALWDYDVFKSRISFHALTNV